MKNVVITIDGGTTNTRCVLWDSDGRVLAQDKRYVGAKNNAVNLNNLELKTALRESLEYVLKAAAKTWENVEYVVASGMITSASGLFEVPHVTAPVGVSELARGVKAKLFPEICPKEIQFIPGVKNHVDEITLDSVKNMDMMRGEETESIALIRRYYNDAPMLLILPGSHNKYVSVNENGQIKECMTAMSGEILAALTKNTILTASLSGMFVDEADLNIDWLEMGIDNCKSFGLGRAAFLTRTLDLFCGISPKLLSSYLLGVVLTTDIEALSGWIGTAIDLKVIIGGSGAVSKALEILLEKKHSKLSILRDSSNVLSGEGARAVLEERMKQSKI